MRDYNYHFKLSENSSLGLDVIRIISIQMVVIGHGISFFGIFTFLQFPNFPWIQNIGVVVFFLLSGFLVTHVTLKKMNNPQYSFKEFFIERASRIYSVYIPVLLIIVGLDAILFLYLGATNTYNSYNVETFFYNILMLQDSFPLLVDSTSFGSARQLWTLPVFWWIYMVFGWLVLGSRTTSNKFVYSIILSLFIFLLVIIILGPRKIGKSRILITWISGSVVAVFLNLIENNNEKHSLNRKNGNFLEKIQKKVNLVFTWFSNQKKLCLILSAFFFGLTCYYVYYTKVAYSLTFSLLLTLTFIFFLIYSYRSRHKFSNRSKKIIKLLASYSFTLYILHYSLFWILTTFTGGSPYLLFPLGFLVSNFLSLIIAYFTEMRSKRVKDYLLNKIITTKNAK